MDKNCSIVVTIDTSRSMDIGDKLRIAQIDAAAFVNIMQNGDNVGVVAFDDKARTVFPTNSNSVVPIPPPCHHAMRGSRSRTQSTSSLRMATPTYWRLSEGDGRY